MPFEKSITILCSENISRSLAYYTEKLGFEAKWEWDNPATFGGVVKDDVELFFWNNEIGKRGSWLCIVLDDVDAYHEKIKALGAEIISPPTSHEWGMREIIVKDPDENYIRFGHRIACD